MMAVTLVLALKQTHGILVLFRSEESEARDEGVKECIWVDSTERQIKDMVSFVLFV